MSKINTLDELFELELRDMYDAEKQLVKALPKVAKKAHNEQLRTLVETHLEETQEHVKRIEQVFALLDLKSKAKTCDGMKGILSEGNEILGEDGDPAVLDAASISAAQRVEHYEITAYGTLIAWSKLLSHPERVSSLLNENLKEEKNADAKLSELAMSRINSDALNANTIAAD